MAAAAIPAISLGAQHFLNRKQNQRTNQALGAATTGLQSSAAELSRGAGQSDALGNAFLGDARQTLQKSAGTFGQVGSYASPLLSGSRGAIDSVLAPERSAITDTYRGAERSLDSMRGGTRDLAVAELNRDRAGRLALLPGQARTAAAQTMMGVGSGQAGVGGAQASTGVGLMGQGLQGRAGAAGAYGSLFGNANNNAALRAPSDAAGSSGIGSMIFDALKSGGKKPGSGSGTLTGLPLGAPTIPGLGQGY